MNTNSITVAIVDDHAMMRNCIHDLVSAWGYRPSVIASNGKELLRQLTKTKAPHICILDLNMPEMNGYETIGRLKENWPEMKILVFSMNIAGKSSSITLQLGADAELPKDSSVSELKKALAGLCTIPMEVV